MDFTKTSLWISTLGDQVNDPHSQERRLLSEAYHDLRQNSAQLVQNISAELRDYTIHDISHLDALWGVASEIAGKGYPITPTEAFVLGGAFLLHDAGMCLAAYPGGMPEVERHERWRALISTRTRRSNAPTEAELRVILADFLRLEHAARARDLPFVKWKTPDGASFYLLEKAELRQKFGQWIGEVAASHWWGHDKVAEAMDRIVSAPPPFPVSWRIDLLKVSLLLRVADAAHVDERRAPGFQWALRSNQMSEVSSRHWLFQNRLTQPDTRSNALHYSSTSDFGPDEAEGWWLAYDTLQMIDRELSQSDALISDLREEQLRFSARRVANAESVSTLQKSIKVRNWVPIDTSIKISDVVTLVGKLGGEALYGRKPDVALRELVQNAQDSITIRSTVDPAWTIGKGEVRVVLRAEGDADVLEVSDNGVGMSAETLSTFLLDFGSSGWLKDPAFAEYARVGTSRPKTVGKYGIGFFSVFMVADKIDVVTRRFDGGYDQTLVLTFTEGLRARPILRQAQVHERLSEGGATVRLRLRSPARSKGGLLGAGSQTLIRMCGELFPALCVRLYICDNGKEAVFGSDDWLSLSATELLSRLRGAAKLPQWTVPFVDNMRPLRSKDGSVVGRLAIVGHFGSGRDEFPAVITTKGISAGKVHFFCGVVEGEVVGAARSAAVPAFRETLLHEWVKEQRGLLESRGLGGEIEAECASVVRRLGEDTGHLKICLTADGWLSKDQLREYIRSRGKVFIVHDSAFSLLKRREPSCVLLDGVIAVEMAYMSFMQGEHGAADWESEQLPHSWRYSAFMEGVVYEALEECWSLSEELLQAWCNDVFEGRRTIQRPIAVAQGKGGMMFRLKAKELWRTMAMSDLDVARELAARESRDDDADVEFTWERTSVTEVR